jgi:hypothetical protein
MSFAGTAARGSAISTPIAGMTTYLEDTKDLQIYDGTSYASPFGLTLIRKDSFTTTTTLDVDNVFSSEFDEYQVILSVTSSTAVDALYQNRVSGTTANANYDLIIINSQGSLSTTRTTAASAGQIGRLDGNGGFIEFKISNPFLAARTFITTQSVDSATFIRVNGIAHQLANSYTGFRLTLNNSTGNIRVYGFRK